MRKSILISADIHKRLKKYCIKNNIVMVGWLETLISEKLDMEKNGTKMEKKLP